MRLKRLSIAGFKSFAGLTTLVFPTNRVGIVGPNGCGKSNVLDAIRWVMGERGAKSFRATQMIDVIFSGSQTRGPASRAMVELVLDNEEPHARLEGPFSIYPEITVRRELSRDGQSSYFLNGTACRRLDVMDLFLGTGLGPNSYAVIEQGMIARVVESNPQELRRYVEEAAGLTRYHERKKETETHLQKAETNAARLHDLWREQQTHVARLAKQAERAQRYQAIQADRDLAEGMAAAIAAQALAERLQTVEAACAQADQETERLYTACQAIQEQLTAGQATWETQYAELQTVQAEHAAAMQQVQQMESWIRTLQEQIAQGDRQIAKWDTQAQAWNQELQAKEEEYAQCQAEAIRCQEQMQTTQAAWEVAETTYQNQLPVWETAQQGLQHALKKQQAAHHACQTTAWEIAQLETQQSRLEARSQQLQAHLASADPAGLIQKWRASQQVQQETQQVLEAAQIAQQAREHACTQTQQEHTRLQATWREWGHQIQGLSHEIAALEAIQRNTQEGVDPQVWAAWADAMGIATTRWSDTNWQIPAGWEYATERVMGPFLHADLIPETDWEHACTWLTATEQAPPREVVWLRAGKWPVDPELAACMGVYPVASIAEAQARLPELPPGTSCITPEGLWISHHWIRIPAAGDTHADHYLVRQRRLREKEEALQAARQNQAAAQSACDAIAAVWEQQSAERQQGLAQVEAARQAVLAATQAVIQAEAAAQAAEQHAASWQNEWEQVQRDQQQLADRLAALQQQLARCQLEYTQSQQEVATQEAQVAHNRDEQSRCEAARRQAQTERDAATWAHEKNRLRESSLQQWCADLRKRQQILQRDREETQSSQHTHQAQLVTLAAEKDQAGAHAHAIQSRLQALQQAVADHQTHWQSTQKTSQQLQADYEQARSQREAQHLERVRQLADQEHFNAAWSAEKLAPYQARLQEPEAITDGAYWQKQVAAYTQKLQACGSINWAAPQEWEEASAREHDLAAQCSELAASVQSLRETMETIENTLRDSFVEVFEAVNANFQQLFPEIFGGGTAYLSWEGTDPLTAGIAMMAHPVGKRNQSVHLLSGGEKALTALAFLFAIFQRNPAPFCILDEVDAPLDESNLRRFGQLLEKMSASLQLIWITHHPATMAVATHLLGITMQEKGVSRGVMVDMATALEAAHAP